MYFNSQYLPAEIDTFEKLVVWAAVSLMASNPGATATESSDRVAAVVDLRTFHIPPAQTEDDRIIGRMSFPVRQGYNAGPLWNYTKEVSDKQPLPEFVVGDVLPRPNG